MWKHRLSGQNRAKIFVCFIVFVSSKCCQLKREALCLQIWFWNICQNCGSIFSKLYLQHKKKKIMLCVTVNQKMFESCQKICIQVNGDMNFCLKFVGSDAFHMWRWKRTQEASPLLLHEHYTSVTYFETKLTLSPLAYTAHFKWQSEGETSCFPSAAAFLWAQRWSLVLSTQAAVPRSECRGC